MYAIVNRIKSVTVDAVTKAKVAALVVLSTAAASSMAQEVADQGVTAITALGTKATAYIGAAFTVAVLVAGGFWGISMMKKAFGKAK